MHAAANVDEKHFKLTAGSPLETFTAKVSTLTSSARGAALLAEKSVQEMSDQTAAAGTTEGAGTDDAQGQHFIAFVNRGGCLYELDGRNFSRQDTDADAMPFCHGATTDDSFLSDAAKVIREDVMARDPESINFNITALCKI